MKTAFYLVLLANLTLLMYEYHHGTFDQAKEAPVLDPAMLREPIVLAHEQESEPPVEQSALAAPDWEKPEAVLPPPAQQSPESVPFACYEAGPFANERILKVWERVVGEVNGELRPVTHTVQEITDYLVLYPTAGSPDAIKAALQILHDHGLIDAYPLASGDYKGFISLGAFHRDSRAARMQKGLQEKGIEAVVKPRFKDSEQKYGLIKGPAAMAGDLEELGKRYPAVRLNALPDSDPKCRAGDSGQAAVAAVEPKEKEMTPMRPELRHTGIDRAGSALLAIEKPTEQKTPAQPVEQKPQHDEAEVKPVRLVCYEAGPFLNEQSLNVWQQGISGAKAAVKPVFRDGKVASDYLVLYPSPGGEEAKVNINMLHERGLNDVWPLQSGEDKGQISLGVFNREENAVQMQKSLLDKGVNSVVKPRYKNRRQKYALITAPESIAEDLKKLEQKNPDIKIRRLPETAQGCP